MTYDAQQISIEDGAPVELFVIVAGTTTFRYTSADSDQTVDSVTYTAIEGLQRTGISAGPPKRDSEFQIQLPTTDALAQIFVGTMPGITITLTVSRFHSTDDTGPEVIEIFDGIILSYSLKKRLKMTVLTAQSVLAGSGRLIPRRSYRSACNHILYDVDTCQVDDTDVAFRASSLTVASLDGNTLTLSSGLDGTYTDGFMNGGFVEAVGESDFRMIRVHLGDVLTLHSTFSSTPTLVNVFAGCAHTIQVCKSKFDNVDRYGGFAFVPLRNPFQSGLL